MISSTPMIDKKQELIVYAIFLIIGIGLLTGGILTKNSYEYEDALRSVKNFSAKISKITKYDVTYISNKFGANPTTVHNIESSAIKSVGDVYSFDIKNNSNTKKSTLVNSQMLPITQVQKKPSEIQVEIIQNDIPTIGLISKTYFTRDIQETDVSKFIEIEFNPNDLTNIAMSVDGLTWSQSLFCWTLILSGSALVIFCLYMLYTIYFPRTYAKIPSTP